MPQHTPAKRAANARKAKAVAKKTKTIKVIKKK